MATATEENRLASLREAYATLDGVQERAEPMIAPIVATTIEEVKRQIETLEEQSEGEES